MLTYSMVPFCVLIMLPEKKRNPATPQYLLTHVTPHAILLSVAVVGAACRGGPRAAGQSCAGVGSRG